MALDLNDLKKKIGNGIEKFGRNNDTVKEKKKAGRPAMEKTRNLILATYVDRETKEILKSCANSKYMTLSSFIAFCIKNEISKNEYKEILENFDIDSLNQIINR